MIQYNFGCGNFRKPGFINVDVRDDSAADVVAEAWQVEMFPEGAADAVYSRHMLEHLDPQDARRTLSSWWRLLRPGGQLNVIVPDITFHARQILGLAKGPFADQFDHALAGFWGWRDESRGGNREDTHRWGYTEQSLSIELALAGFHNISRVIEGQDSEAWHLNITCSRPSLATSESDAEEAMVG